MQQFFFCLTWVGEVKKNFFNCTKTFTWICKTVVVVFVVYTLSIQLRLVFWTWVGGNIFFSIILKHLPGSAKQGFLFVVHFVIRNRLFPCENRAIFPEESQLRQSCYPAGLFSQYSPNIGGIFTFLHCHGFVSCTCLWRTGPQFFSVSPEGLVTEPTTLRIRRWGWEGVEGEGGWRMKKATAETGSSTCNLLIPSPVPKPLSHTPPYQLHHSAVK